MVKPFSHTVFTHLLLLHPRIHVTGDVDTRQVVDPPERANDIPEASQLEASNEVKTEKLGRDPQSTLTFVKLVGLAMPGEVKYIARPA